MAKLTYFSCFLFLFIISFFVQSSNAAYNVISFGAKPDGKSDATQAFLKAWASACNSATASTIYIPKGRFLLKATVFRGPCKNRITVQIDGTLMAPTDYSALGNSGYWILFIQVNRVAVYGGTLDAKELTGVTIKGSTIQTGDDCISIGPDTKNLLMSNIRCGPGHGVSIGSLGKELNEAGVQNVTLTDSVFTGSDNGVRIKSWARPSNGFVQHSFPKHCYEDVENPITIDQNYCPNNQGCPRQTSGVKISQVTYRNIRGTSGTPEAVTFDCSPSTPCRGIKLQDLKLTYMNRATTSSCKNIGGTSSGVLVPESCL
uniref:Rhamnogalacturonase A/B/Epimerase-like pectate lyase domain-containing protein n=1 Tax=Fagus sylvatica TaxID=28930 RepID=A0A2N9FMF9_FAGSY